MSAPRAFPWSPSRLTAFKKCGKQFWHVTVKKDVPFEQSPQMKEGDVIHKLLEKRVGTGVELPPEYRYLENMCRQIIAAPGQTYTEVKLALDKNLRPCGFKDWQNAWVRAVFDVLKLNGDTAWVGDYKTGIPTMDEFQLKLYAVFTFVVFPDVRRVTTTYLWTKTGKIDPSDSRVYHRDQIPKLWEELLAEAEHLQAAAAADRWPARPGKLCRYCLVNKFGKCELAAMPYRK